MLQHAILAALDEESPLTIPQLAERLDRSRRRTDAAVLALQHRRAVETWRYPEEWLYRYPGPRAVHVFRLGARTPWLQEEKRLQRALQELEHAMEQDKRLRGYMLHAMRTYVVPPEKDAR